MIRCKNVYKSFGDKNILNGMNFEIPDGQIFGLLGPSGAGKAFGGKMMEDNKTIFDYLEQALKKLKED